MRVPALIRDERGQDLIEYTLLLGFVALGSAALFVGAGGSIGGVWRQVARLLTGNKTGSTDD